MIDIHSHILHDIDDGSKSINESINILKQMKEYGYTDIILTPHFIVDSIYENTLKKKKDKLEELKKEVKKQKIKINLYLGNEIYIDENIKKYLKRKALPLNDSKYVLIELPMSGEFNNYYGIFLGIIEKGYKIILAHPERYETVKKDYHVLDELKDIGIIFQSNIGSIFGMYGKDCKKTIKKLLKNNYISMFSSDIHHETYHFSYMKDIRKKLKKYMTEEEIDDVLINNNKKIINNKEI